MQIIFDIVYLCKIFYYIVNFPTTDKFLLCLHEFASSEDIHSSSLCIIFTAKIQVGQNWTVNKVAFIW